MKHFLRILLMSILTCLPFTSFAQSVDPYDWDIIYDWGTITIEVGQTVTLSHKFEIPYSSKVKYIKWGSMSPDNCVVVSQNQSSCTIKGVSPIKAVDVWCQMKYGETTYEGIFEVKVVKSSTPIKISASPSGGELIAGSKVYLNATPEANYIYYTLDGTTPTQNSTKYNDYTGITINNDCTLKAIATSYNYADSEIFTATYTTSYPKNATFTEKTVEGVDMTFKVLDATNKIVEISSVNKDASGSLTIPSEIKGYKVTRIGMGAFSGCTQLTSVVIPNSVTTIVYDAFYGCSSLQKISIPNSVTSIGFEAFSGCSSLTSVDIPNSVTSIKSETFRDCRSLASVVIPNSVSEIEYASFYGCTSLSSVDIPNSVTTIGSYAFSYCSKLEEVSLPTSLTRLESYTFSGCNSLSNLKGGNKIEFIGISAIPTNCSWARNLPDGMNFLGKVLFMYQGEMPANTTINIPAGCTQICSKAFVNKEGLDGINIPTSVTDIAEGAFQNCANLQNITVDASNTVYDSRNNCNAIIKKATNTLTHGCSGTTIPTNVTSIGASAFYGNWTKDEIVIPNQIDSIASYAFYNCSNAKSVLIGKGLRKLGSYAFAQLPHLKEIAVSTSNPYFDSRDNCNAIIEKATNTLLVGCSGTTIPNSVKIIGSYAFYGNGDESFTSLVIPNSVEEIKSYAFNALPYLREASIGANVKTFGNYMFYKCNNLEAIESLNGFPDDIDEKVFNSGSKDFSIYDNVTLYVPVGCRNNYRLATGWSNFKNIVEGSLLVSVDDVLTPQPKEEVIYSPTGVRLSAPQRGVNIVNGRKLLVK